MSDYAISWQTVLDGDPGGGAAPFVPKPLFSTALVGDLWSVAANSNMSLILAGSQNAHGTIARSSDGGNTWTIDTTSLPSTDFVRDFLFVDETQTALVAPPGDYLYRTTNFGGSWTQLTTPGQHAWGSFCCSDDRTSIFISSDDTSYLSTDGGATWTARSNNAPCTHQYGIICASANFGLLYCLDQATNLVVSVSTNSGNTWTALGTQPVAINFFQGITCSADGQTILLADIGGQIARSTNGGSSWSYITLPNSPHGPPNNDVFNRRVPNTSGRDVVVDGDYAVWITHDGGATWALDGPITTYLEQIGTSPFHMVLSNDGLSKVIGGEYFNVRVVIERVIY
jgi:photosystem II stability/assembly factor-like uncharacterized protein